MDPLKKICQKRQGIPHSHKPGDVLLCIFVFTDFSRKVWELKTLNSKNNTFNVLMNWQTVIVYQQHKFVLKIKQCYLLTPP